MNQKAENWIAVYTNDHTSNISKNKHMYKKEIRRLRLRV